MDFWVFKHFDCGKRSRARYLWAFHHTHTWLVLSSVSPWDAKHGFCQQGEAFDNTSKKGVWGKPGESVHGSLRHWRYKKVLWDDEKYLGRYSKWLSSWRLCSFVNCASWNLVHRFHTLKCTTRSERRRKAFNTLYASLSNVNPLSTDFSASRRLKFGLRTQRAISQQLQALPPR